MRNLKLKNRGFTLTELIIYIMISSMVLSIMLTIFFFVQKAYRKTTASYGLMQESYAGIQWLKNDLAQSSLSSIKIYPNDDKTTEASGFSMISAIDKDGNLQFSKYGTPRWENHVFYTLVDSGDADDGFTPRTAKLIRWKNPLDYNIGSPFPTDILPSKFASKNATPRVIFKSLMAPGDPQMKGIDHLKDGTIDVGGFRIAFVRKKFDDTGGTTKILTELSDVNPSEVTDKDGKVNGVYPTQTTTELVQVDLIILEIGEESGKPSAYSMSFQVKPRN